MGVELSALAGVGVAAFLSLRETSLVVISGSRAATLPSPYLDEFGEQDKEFASGRTLYRNDSRWERFEALWRLAAIEFDTILLQNASGGRAGHGAQVY